MTTSVFTHPSSPNQSCLITSNNATGNLDGMGVVVDIQCTTLQYNVGVDVSGLADDVTLVVMNNSEELIISNEGAFLFLTPILDEGNYDVQILLQPESPIQPCTSLNSSGDLNGSDIVDIEINCEVGDDLIYKQGFEELPTLFN